MASARLGGTKPGPRQVTPPFVVVDKIHDDRHLYSESMKLFTFVSFHTTVLRPGMFVRSSP